MVRLTLVLVLLLLLLAVLRKPMAPRTERTILPPPVFVQQGQGQRAEKVAVSVHITPYTNTIGGPDGESFLVLG